MRRRFDIRGQRRDLNADLRARRNLEAAKVIDRRCDIGFRLAARGNNEEQRDGGAFRQRLAARPFAGRYTSSAPVSVAVSLPLFTSTTVDPVVAAGSITKSAVT